MRRRKSVNHLALGRHKTGRLNKTEQAYADRLHASARRVNPVAPVRGHQAAPRQQHVLHPGLRRSGRRRRDGAARGERALAGRCQGEDQDRGRSVPVPVHRGARAPEEGRRRLGGGVVPRRSQHPSAGAGGCVGTCARWCGSPGRPASSRTGSELSGGCGAAWSCELSAAGAGGRDGERDGASGEGAAPPGAVGDHQGAAGSHRCGSCSPCRVDSCTGRTGPIQRLCADR